MKKTIATILVSLAASGANASLGLVSDEVLLEQLSYCHEVTFTTGAYVNGRVYMNGYLTYPGHGFEKFTLATAPGEVNSRAEGVEMIRLYTGQSIPCAAAYAAFTTEEGE